MINPRLTLAVVLATCALGCVAGDIHNAVPRGAYLVDGGAVTPYRYESTSPSLFGPHLTGDRSAGIRQISDKPYSLQIERAAKNAGIDPLLVHAVVAIESGYNPRAQSPKGAIGLMQVMPGTALRYGISKPLRDPDVNLTVGTLYLSDLLKLFGNRLDLALAAYNAGEFAVIRRNLRVPPYRETREYIPSVLARYDELLRSTRSSSDHIEYLHGTRLRFAVRKQMQLERSALQP